jgi:hypothetical protein
LVSHFEEGIQTEGFEKSVLRIFGPKREEDRPWRKLHNDELHSLYSSLNTATVIKSRMTKWAGHVARMGAGKGVYRILVGRAEGKRPLGRPRRRWEDNIKMGLTETVRLGEQDSAGSVQGPVVGFCEHGNEPSGSIKKAGYCLTS